ncbi:MAG: cation transporter [Planctomycetes bacterium]|nr:cation transporter [Planctomycetota bacterium]
MLVIEGIANVVGLSIKLVVGICTGSFAVLADAVHSITDVANNIVAYVVMHFASKPADKEHPYGHRKYETLAVFVLATLLTVLAIEISIHAIRSGTREVLPSGIGLIAMLGLLVLQAGVAFWESRQATRLNSDLLRADARHTMSDVYVTVGVIVGWQVSALGYAWVDTLITISVALVVLWFALDLFRRVVPVLVDEIAHDPDDLRDAASGVEGVRSVRTVRSRWIGSDAAIDVVVTVKADLPTDESHEIADAVEHLLSERFDAAYVNVHVEPHRADQAADTTSSPSP